MNWQRIELHNHTEESDGSFTVPELVEFFRERGVTCFVLTDHNNVSGQEKIHREIGRRALPMECLDGMEVTTYLGHLLCYNVSEYIVWEDFIASMPERLFARVHEAGGLCGIAHPFSMGHPVAQGCRWEMTVNDYSQLDFIEVVNNSESFEYVNRRGIDWWQELFLAGHALAPVTGLDLHGPRELDETFLTLLPYEGARPPAARLLETCIRRCRTLVTRGPVFMPRVEGDTLRVALEAEHAVHGWAPGADLTVEVFGRGEAVRVLMRDGVAEIALPAGDRYVVRICERDRLLALAAVR